MSIQGNINQILGDLSRHITTGAIAVNTAKQADELARLNKYELTEEEETAAMENFEAEKSLRQMEEYLDKMDPESDAYKREMERYEKTADKLRESREKGAGAEAEKKRYLSQLRRGVSDGGIYTPEEMQRAQMDMYRNLAALKLGEINNRASYAQGIDPYGRETVNGVPKFQHSTDDLSNDDWGVQG